MWLNILCLLSVKCTFQNSKIVDLKVAKLDDVIGLSPNYVFMSDNSNYN